MCCDLLALYRSRLQVAELTGCATSCSKRAVKEKRVLNGKAFAGFRRGTMVFKLTAPQHATALALPGARLFDPSEQGRPWKEWVEVPAEHASQWLELAQAAYRYVDTTP